MASCICRYQRKYRPQPAELPTRLGVRPRYRAARRVGPSLRRMSRNTVREELIRGWADVSTAKGQWQACPAGKVMVPCSRVLIMSKGCTTMVDTRPADRPAMVSMEAGLRPWRLGFVMGSGGTIRRCNNDCKWTFQDRESYRSRCPVSGDELQLASEGWVAASLSPVVTGMM